MRQAPRNIQDQPGISKELFGELNTFLLYLNQNFERHSEDEILDKTLEKSLELSGSAIGYLHFVNPDQRTVSLTRWSAKTMRLCDIPKRISHYPIADAGVWVDCIHQKEPVIHNAYEKLDHKKGLPQGHVPLIRDVGIPVFESDRVVAVLGVGNKPDEYNQQDVDLLQALANKTWDVIIRKRSLESEQYSIRVQRTLHDLLLFLNQCDSLDETASYLCHTAVSITELSGSIVYFVEGNKAVVRYQQGMPNPFVNTLRRLPLDLPQVQKILSTKEVVDIRTASDEIAGLCKEYNIEHFYGVALKAGEETFGFLNLAGPAGKPFDEKKLYWLKIMVLNTEAIFLRLKRDQQLHQDAHILANINDSVISTDKDGYITFWNTRAEQLYGWTAETVIGKNIKDIIPIRINDIDWEKIYAKVRAEKAWQGEVVHFNLQRKKIFVEWSITQIQNDRGEAGGIVGIAKDITDRKQAEDAIRKSEALYHDLVETSQDLIWQCNTEGRYTYLNPAWEHVLGYKVKDMLGRRPSDFQSPDYADKDKKKFLNLVRGKGIKGYETVYLHKNGHEVYLVFNAKHYYGEKGELAGISGTAYDITKRKEAEKILKTLNKALERSNKDLQDFAYIASHDLQEPLRKIVTISDILLSMYNDVIDDEGRDYFARMQNASRRMSKLIEDLLQLSRLSTRAQPFKPVDLNKILENVCSDLEISIRESNAQIKMDKLPTIPADETQIRQLFQNLISNALKFRKKDMPPVLKISCQSCDTAPNKKSENGLHRIVFEDNGIGFDQKYAERIFIPFQRLHSRNQYPGTGIGLALCRKIIDRHGGQIYTESQAGVGSKFILDFQTYPERSQINEPS